MFATLTAPSFGPVHSRRMRGKTVLPCRPRRDANARRCPHGRDISCPTRHVETDPRLGQPMCGDCYDYDAAVLFNAYAADLWRRFVTYLPRQLARRLGITQKRLRALVRIRFVKVAEYQARGVVHFHAVIRLDAPGEDYQPPPPGIDADMLCDAIGQAAAARRPAPSTTTASAVTLGFGAQTDTRIIRPGSRAARHRPGAERPGRGELHRQVRHQDPHRPRPARPAAPASDGDLEHLRCTAHYRRMITTAWQLGSTRPAIPVPGLGAHARLRRPLPDQIPPLLRHLRPAPHSPHRPPPRRPATPAATATPGAGPSTKPSSWSCPPPGPTPEPAHTATPIAELAAASAARAREHYQADHAA